MYGGLLVLKIIQNKKMRKNRTCKKGQFKIQQMSFMLLAVVLFFILVALFWLSIKSAGLKKEATSLEQEKAFTIAQFLAGSAEFSCSAEMGSYCIDTDKLIVLANKTDYKEFWPVSYVKARKVLLDEKEKICNKANYPDCNSFNVYNNNKIQSNSSIGSFIALCRHDKIDESYGWKCELGKLIIGYGVK